MPIKVRCSKCQKVVNAPDQAQGKAVRCPGCKSPIRVPAAAAATAKKRAPAAGSAEDEDFLKRIDVRQLEHQSERVCPKCAAAVGPEDIDCPECGVNIETGVMSEDQRRVRERIGPDPALFYSKVWSNSWNFLKKNKLLAFRTALYWTIFIENAAFFGHRTFDAMNREEVSEFGRNFETAIWGSVTFLCLVGIFGWYWYMTVRVTQLTLEKQKKVKDVHFDIHQCMALGVKAVVWPIVLMTPVMWAVLPIVLFVYFMNMLDLESLKWPLGITFGALAVFPYLAFPVAMAHMTMPFTYKAWLPTEMAVLFFKNIGAVLYWWLMALIVVLPFVGYAFLLDYFFGEFIANIINDGIEAAINAEPEKSLLVRVSLWCAGLMTNMPQREDFSYLMFFWMFLVLTTMIAIASFVIPLAFPAVFMARANALLIYYRSQTLDLVTHTRQGELAGFWIRYLAFMIDHVIIAAMFGVFLGIFGLFYAIFVLGFGVEVTFALAGITGMLGLFGYYMYYVRSEIGNSQGTFGKSSLGLLVTDMEGNKINRKTARKRLAIRLLLTLTTTYISHLMVLFSKDKQTLVDSLTKTKVVWEGEREG